MEELIKLDAYPIRGLVRRLLQDKTTRKNIMFASDSYADYGAGYRDNSQMTEGVLLGFDSCDIQPRVYKAASEQTERTRKRAEVFTPAWIVNQMNNYCDAEWFGRPDVFNRQNGQSWEINTEPILFPEGKDWKQYVNSRRLEITCGEAPYIVSRYDTSTGEIIPIEKRIGILDRKLRIVNENAADEEECTKGVMDTVGTIAYKLRAEQEQAVSQTFDYFMSHEKGEFLWNAKPRFGKTLATYDLCKRLQATKGDYACNILIVTNRPAIANSWYEDFVKFIGTESGFRFVSEVSALKGKPFVMSRDEYTDSLLQEIADCIEFVSLQDLKGSLYFGGQHDKLKELVNMKWELLVIDEAHEGVDTSKTDVAFHQIKRNHTLHLSGNPFKALANDKFPSDAIYNWTYADEQKAKAGWNDAERNNPYENLPQLNLFTYQMSEIIREELQQGVEIEGETEEYAFDLNLFFSVKANGEFVYEESVDRFLEALTSQEKFPFSTPELRAELKHTFWLLNRVDSAKALAKKLKEHPIFGEYEIVLATVLI